MHPKEKAIKERRLIEATRKDIMGVAGKLGQIAKWLGEPIIRQGSGLCEVRTLDDPFADPEDVPVMEDEFNVFEGWFFSGLSRGIHLEIIYQKNSKQLTVDYKGYRVFTENNGDLENYVPFPDWEDLVENLYQQARDKQKKTDKENKKEEEKTMLDAAKNFLQMLRFKWGI